MKHSGADHLEQEPSYVAELFGSRIGLARQFTLDLAQRGEELGLIGPLEPPRLWTRHIVNSVLVAPLLRPGRTGDIGSGAGLPGLVLAIARPDVSFVLVEPMERRVEWLSHEVAELGLDNVTVVRSRAEELTLDEPLDQVTARAVTSLAKLIPATASLVRSGGQMLFLKGERVNEEISAAARQIRTARLRDIEVVVLGAEILPEITRVFRATVD